MSQESYLPPQNVSSVEKIQTPEIKSEEQNYKPTINQEQFDLKISDLKTEKELTLAKMNSIRSNLGLPETNELPVYLVDKENKLNKLAINIEDKKPEDYLNFEMVEEKEKQRVEKQIEVIVEKKVEVFYGEMQSISAKEYQFIKKYGTYSNGTYFQSVSFGEIQPAIMLKLIAFYESHQVVNSIITQEFIKEEPEAIELVAEEIKLEAADENQKLLEYNYQNKIEEGTTQAEIPENISSLENPSDNQLNQAA